MKINWNRPFIDRAVEVAKEIEASTRGAESVELTDKEFKSFIREANELSLPISPWVRVFTYKGMDITYRLNSDWFRIGDTEFYREPPK